MSTEFRPPVVYHPGETLKEKLEELNMSIKEFAIRTSKPEKTIYAVINGQSSITPDMAIAFEKVTGIPMHMWLKGQRRYDEYKAEKKQEEKLSALHNWAKSFPLQTMQRYRWISFDNSIQSSVNAILSFFQVSSEQGWKDYYFNQQLKIAFRISLNATKEPYAISAWLRQGEIQASQMSVTTFDVTNLKKVLPSLKELCTKQPDDFIKQLQGLCASVGIKLLLTQRLPKAPISGATRWIHDSPCIQLTDRYKRNDAFWFTFFHEVGHIILHGKKDIFLEDTEYSDKEQKKEDEADHFASEILLPIEQENEIIQHGNYSESTILTYAEKFNVHPAIIVGRLQHRGIIPYSLLQNLKVNINLFA